MAQPSPMLSTFASDISTGQATAVAEPLCAYPVLFKQPAPFSAFSSRLSHLKLPPCFLILQRSQSLYCDIGERARCILSLLHSHTKRKAADHEPQGSLSSCHIIFSPVLSFAKIYITDFIPFSLCYEEISKRNQETGLILHLFRFFFFFSKPKST